MIKGDERLQSAADAEAQVPQLGAEGSDNERPMSSNHVAVVLAYNRRDLTLACLRSLRAQNVPVSSWTHMYLTMRVGFGLWACAAGCSVWLARGMAARLPHRTHRWDSQVPR